MDQERGVQERSGRVTIYDVARHAGVAISTVSRVLNGADDVSQQTRQRVMQIVEKLQYRPHRTARTLAQKQLTTLAVAVPTFTMPIFTELLKGVQDHLRQHQIDLLLCDLGSSEMRVKLRRFMDRGAVDGLLLAGLPVDAKLTQELALLGTHVVLVGAASETFDSFWWDDEAGARAAVQYLIGQGHRHIGMIAPHEDGFGNEARQRGYRAALEAAGLPFEPAMVQRGETSKHMGSSEEAGYEAMERLLARAPALTAVFAASDVLAIGAAKVVQDRGWDVPEQISIIGYENIKVSRYIGLTTVDLEMHEVGRLATELLLSRMQRRTSEAPRQTRIEPHLILRRSSAAVRPGEA